jgi:hypothetical protein
MDTVGSSGQFRLDKTTTNTEKRNGISVLNGKKILAKHVELLPAHITKAHRGSSGITTLILNLVLDGNE